MKRFLLFLVLTASSWATPATCDGGKQKTFTVGTPGSLTATSSGAGGTVSYTWTQASYTQPGISTQASLAFGTANAITTTISGYIFGPVNVTVTCTDSVGGGSITSTVHHGAVVTDSAGNIIYPAPYAVKLATILGPQTIMNRSCDLTSCDSSPGSWADQLQFNWAYHFGNAQGTVPIAGASGVSFVKYWEGTPVTGTVAVSMGGTTVTGSSTTFGDTFCGQHTSFPCAPLSTAAYITIAHCTSGTIPTCLNSLTTSGRVVFAIASVASQTSMTIGGGPAPNWFLPSVSGTNYYVSGNPELTAWSGLGPYINYYDDVDAFYATYYRTGIEDFLGFARWLADAWWYSPYRDQFTCDSSGAFNCGLPRTRSLQGIVIRAIDEDTVAGSLGASVKWTNLRTFWTNVSAAEVFTERNLPILDLREESYRMAELALDAIANPNGTEAQTALVLYDNQVKTGGRWQVQRYSDGKWTAEYCYNNGGQICSDDGSVGTITATAGSNAITLSGNTWTTGNFCNAGTKATIYMGTTGFSPNGWDSRGYIATRTGTTTATLDANYVDTGGSGKIFDLSCGGGSTDWVGPLVQPFILGITSNQLRLGAYALVNSGTSAPFDAVTAATINTTWLPGIATYLGTTALNTDTCSSPCLNVSGVLYRGPFYGVGGGVCGAPYGPLGNLNQCYGVGLGSENSTQESRELSPELTNAITTGYCLSKDPNLLTYGNNYYTAMFAKSPSQTGYDGSWISEMDISGFFWNTYNGKWWGFFWGYGRNQDWLSGAQGCGVASGGTSKGGNKKSGGNFQSTK